jgi:hypothetical protein
VDVSENTEVEPDIECGSNIIAAKEEAIKPEETLTARTNDLTTAPACSESSQPDELEESLRRRKEELDREKKALRGFVQDFFSKVDKRA